MTLDHRSNDGLSRLCLSADHFQRESVYYSSAAVAHKQRIKPRICWARRYIIALPIARVKSIKSGSVSAYAYPRVFIGCFVENVFFVHAADTNTNAIAYELVSFTILLSDVFDTTPTYMVCRGYRPKPTGFMAQQSLTCSPTCRRLPREVARHRPIVLADDTLGDECHDFLSDTSGRRARYREQDEWGKSARPKSGRVTSCSGKPLLNFSTLNQMTKIVR